MTDNFSTLHGQAALDFIEQHLTKVGVDPLNWTVEYRDKKTGVMYVLDYPHAEQQGGGEPRLARKASQ